MSNKCNSCSKKDAVTTNDKVVEEVVTNLLCYLVDNHECQPLDENKLQEIGYKFLHSKYNQTKIDGHNTTYDARCFVGKHNEFIDGTSPVSVAIGHILKVCQENEILTLACYSFRQDTDDIKAVKKEWEMYKQLLMEKYPAEENKEFEFTCEHHKKIDKILNKIEKPKYI